MEPAIHDLVRELDAPLVLEHDVVDVHVEDDLLLDPWFWRTEEEFAAIEDDPTAKIIEIKIGPLDQKIAAAVDQGTGFDDKRWAF